MELKDRKILRLPHLTEAVDEVLEQIEWSATTEDTLKALFAVIENALLSGQRVVLPGIGMLSVRARIVQSDLDPDTNEDDGDDATQYEKTIRLPFLRCSDDLKYELNKEQ